MDNFQKRKNAQNLTLEDITWMRRKFAFWTLDNVSTNHKDYVDVDGDERDRTVNRNLTAVVFMLSGLLNRGAPLQTLTLPPDSNSRPKRPTLFAHISTRQSRMRRRKRIITDVHRSRSTSTGNLWTLPTPNQLLMVVLTPSRLPAVPYLRWGEVVVVVENRQKPLGYTSSKLSTPRSIFTRF